jgi:hypothetical protein
MNLLQNIMENFLNVKLALASWIKVLFYLGAKEKVDRGRRILVEWCIGTLTIE